MKKEELEVSHSNFQNFIRNWKKKAESYEVFCLSDYYDLFFTRYVIYNALYYHIDYLSHLDKTKQKKFGDRKSAINMMATEIMQHNPHEFVEKIKSDLEEIWKYCSPQSISRKFFFYDAFDKREKRLTKELNQTKVDETKLLAILEAIYRIRCNMFHGSKNYDDFQKYLLEPTNNILLHLNSVAENIYEKKYGVVLEKLEKVIQ